MKKNVLKIITFFILSVIIITYGWSMFQKINHNRLVFQSNIYTHVPDGSIAIINFSRNHHFDEYFEIDTTNTYIIDHIKEDITYPLLIAKFNNREDLLLTKTTKKQEIKLIESFQNDIAPYHAPQIKKYNGVELNFYSLATNDFIITCFHEGILAISKDYIQIENFINKKSTSPFFDKDHAQLQHYAAKILANAPISTFIHSDSTSFVLAYTQHHDSIILQGEYFGKLVTDSVKLSYNEMNQVLQMEEFYTDSIDWQDENKIKVWINKVNE